MNWIKWSLFALSIISLILLVVFVTNKFSRFCPSSYHYDDIAKMCVPNASVQRCVEGQQYYPTIGCSYCPPNQVYDIEEKHCCAANGVCTKPRYSCDAYSNKCNQDANGEYGDLGDCQRDCFKKCQDVHACFSN